MAPGKQKRRPVRWLLVLVLIVSALPVTVLAAPSLQTGQEIQLPGSVTVTLDDATPEANVAFTVGEAFPFSVVAAVQSGDITTTVSVAGPDGQIVASAQASSDPAVTFAEAITAPATGIYTATVSRAGGTVGEVQFSVLPGFANLDIQEDFESAPNDLNLTWLWYDADFTVQDIVDGQLHISLLDPSTLTYWTPEEATSWPDFYAETTAWVDGRPSYWEYGFIFRVDWDTHTYYLLTLSAQKDWDLYFNQDGEWIEIQPWTASDVIDVTARNPRIGVWAQGNTFRLYFNHQLIGEVTDPNNYAAEGTLGYAIATIDQPDDLNVYFDDLVITTPLGLSPGMDSGVVTQETPAVPGGLATKTPAPTLGGLGGLGLPGRSTRGPGR